MAKSKYVFDPLIEFKKEYYECKFDDTAILVHDDDYWRRWKKVWGTDAVLVYEVSNQCIDKDEIGNMWKRLSDQEVKILKKLYENRIG